MAKLLTVWADNEIRILKEKYGTMPNKELSEILGKTKQALQHKAHRLHITTFKVAQPRYCIDCGVVLGRSSWNIKKVLRCKSCEVKRNVGKVHHNWKGGKPHCKQCGASLSRYDATLCNICYAKITMKDEKHPKWKGGISSVTDLVYNLLRPVWVQPILKKSKYTCQFCHKRGGDMEVHHIYPHRLIREKVIKANSDINIRTFEGKKQMALLVVAEHKLEYGICLCKPCHKQIHSEKRGELLEHPNNFGGVMDNQQPSLPNVLQFVGKKVHRLTGEDTQSNKPDTSAPHLISHEGDDIVGTYGLTVRSER